MERLVPIEIVAPILGVNKQLTPSMINSRMSPNENNANSFYGMLQKDYGTTLFSTGTLGNPVQLLYRADWGSTVTLQAFTQTNMYKYSSSADAFIVDGQTSTATFSDFPSVCMHNNVLVYANGVNLIQAKTGYGSTGDVMAGVATGSYKAYTVVSFKEHLNLYHTIEAGNECPRRARWTNVGLLGFTGTDWTAGTAGFLDLQDAEGEFMTAEKLGSGAVAIYAENSIHLQEWVGGSDVYRFTKMVGGLGTPSRRGVVANKSVHYMLSRTNVWEYTGNRTPTPIGDGIQQWIRSEVNQNMIQNAFLTYNEADGELRVYVPTGTATYPNKCLICKVNADYAWHIADRPYTAGGEFSEASSVTIGELVGNIGAQNWTFGSMAVKSGTITKLLGDQSGRVVKYDNTVYSLCVSGATTAQSFVFDTKEITAENDVDPLTKDKYNLSMYGDSKSRWLTVKAEVKGYGNLYLKYSVDGGSTWKDFPQTYQTMTPNWEMQTWDIDEAAEKLMIRFTNTATNEVVHLRYIKAQFVPGGE